MIPQTCIFKNLCLKQFFAAHFKWTKMTLHEIFRLVLLRWISETAKNHHHAISVTSCCPPSLPLGDNLIPSICGLQYIMQLERGHGRVDKEGLNLATLLF